MVSPYSWGNADVPAYLPLRAMSVAYIITKEHRNVPGSSSHLGPHGHPGVLRDPASHWLWCFEKLYPPVSGDSTQENGHSGEGALYFTQGSAAQ